MLRPLYNWTMAKAAHPHAEWYLAALSFMDGGLFPFPPHPLLGLMCLAEPKKAVRFALITTIASVLGGLLGYTIGHFLYDTVGGQLLGALGLTESFPKAACYLRAYGWQIIDDVRRLPRFIDRILGKGVQPAELPVEQPTVFRLVVNLKTAKAIGVAVPRSVLLRADEVIE